VIPAPSPFHLFFLILPRLLLTLPV
jgi:hypothetical protein